MKKGTSQWSKDVRKAAIDQDITLKELAESIGYSCAVVSAVIHGRYSNASYQTIAKKINEKLGTTGLPERTLIDEWCQAVKIELVKRKMNVNQLAEKVNVSRDRLSLVINGKQMTEDIVEKVNHLLGITLPVITAADD